MRISLAMTLLLTVLSTVPESGKGRGGAVSAGGDGPQGLHGGAPLMLCPQAPEGDSGWISFDIVCGCTLLPGLDAAQATQVWDPDSTVAGLTASSSAGEVHRWLKRAHAPPGAAAA